MCLKPIKTCGNTTNMKNHLMRKHKSIYKQEMNEKKRVSKTNSQTENKDTSDEEDEDDIDSPLPCTGSSSNRTQAFDSNPLRLKSVTHSPCNKLEQQDTAITSGTNSLPLHSEVSSESSQTKMISKTRNETVQRTIDQSFAQIESYKENGSKAAKITNAILFMIAKDNMPYYTVEKEGFQTLMKITCPLYKVLGRKTITELMTAKYEIFSNITITEISNVEFFSLTTDVWTDTSNSRSYLGLTAHYIMNSEFKNRTIGVTELTERHTGKYLGEWILQILSEWKIDRNKVAMVITDNGSNMIKAVNEAFGNSKHLSCFAHSLNLVATYIIDKTVDVKNVCDKIKAIVTYFKASILPADELRKVSHLKLIQSVPTRWNSTFFMLERFIFLSEQVSSILLRFPKSPPMLSASELELVKQIILVLQPIESVSREVCGENYVTSSKIIPILTCLEKNIESIDSDTLTDVGIELKESVLTQLNKRFRLRELVSSLAISTILDPRFKKLHFQDSIACTDAVTKISKLCTQLATTDEQEEQIALGSRISEEGSTSKDDIWTYHRTLVKTQQIDPVDTSNDVSTELKHYLNQPLIDLKDDPLHFWKINMTMYPTLTRVAKRYLSIVATSVPSERLFSKAGNIVTQSRSRLSPKHLQQLLFLNSLSKEEWQL